MSTEKRIRLWNELEKNSNAIVECSRLLAEKLWKPDMDASDFVLAGLAEAILASAEKLEDLLDDTGGYIVRDGIPQTVDQESAAGG
jgi:hypothetical protein